MTDDLADHFIARATVAYQAGEPERAAALCGLGLQVAPDHPRLLHVMAVARWASGALSEAMTLLRQVIDLTPANPRPYADLGMVLAEMGEERAAHAVWEAARLVAPEDPETLLNLGRVRGLQGRWQESADLCGAALRGQPESAEMAFHLGSALCRLERFEEAVAAFRQVLALRPGSAPGLTNLGVVLKRLGQVAAAVTCHRRAVTCEPGHVDAHWNLSHALLTLGDLEEGLAEAEWRLRRPETIVRAFPLPRWRGEALAGRRLLLYGEQGAGDMIHFVRYARLVAEAGGQVVLECHAGLERLLATAPGVAGVFTIGAPPPPADLYAPLLSVPALLGVGWATVPRKVPYLSVPPGVMVPHLRGGGGLKVGIVWSGNVEFVDNFERLCPLPLFAKLARVPGVTLYSLQKGPPGAALAAADAPAGIVDLSSYLFDFAATAALINRLDLVVTVDTSVAHLAGALAAPTLTLLGYHCDWRWQRDRADCPWYPTMTLLRQPVRGDWLTPMTQAVREVERLAEIKRHGPRA